MRLSGASAAALVAFQILVRFDEGGPTALEPTISREELQRRKRQGGGRTLGDLENRAGNT